MHRRRGYSSKRRSRTRASNCCVEHFDVDVETSMTDDELKTRINDWDGLIIRSSTKVTADILEQLDPPEDHRPGGHRRRQHRRGDGDQEGHHRRQRARVEHRGRGRAGHRAPGLAGAQHPAGQRLDQGGQVGEVEVRGCGVDRQDARYRGSGPHRQAGRAAGQGPAHGSHGVRSVRHGRAVPRDGHRAGRDARGGLREGRLHHRAPAQDAPTRWVSSATRPSPR